MKRPLKVEMNGVVVIEGHVQGLSNTRALGEAGIPVIVVDMNNCLARYSRYCKGFYYCPDYLSDDFADFLIELASDYGLKNWVLLPSNDHAVHTISRNLEKLSVFYKTLVPSMDVLRMIYDKLNLVEVAKSCNIPVPVTFVADFSDPLIPSGISFPVITKGRNGLSFYRKTGRKAILSDNADKFRKDLGSLKNRYPDTDTYSQELIPSDSPAGTVSFTTFCIDGEIKSYWAGEKLREHPVRFGTGTFARSIEKRELLEPSARLMKKLKYTGVCEIEYLLDPRDRQYKLIEINARTWLWVGLARRCGIDYALMIYNYLNNNDMQYPRDYEADIYWVNLITDVPYSVIAMIKGKLSPLRYLRSFRSKTVNAVLSARDIMPVVMLVFLSVYIFFKRR